MIKGIPESERIWVEETSENGTVYYITAKVNDRSLYYLYKDDDGKAVKLGKARSPTELEEKYIS